MAAYVPTTQNMSAVLSPFFTGSPTTPDEPLIAPQTSTSSSERLVGEACLEFLNIEMVSVMFKTNENTNGTDGEGVDKEAVYYKLEMLGYRVGQSLVERFTRDRPRFVDTLDVVKFVCKDLWTIIFKKQIDNLKTNHRGVYVLQDNSFRWFMRMSTDTGSSDAVKKAIPYLWFPCGIIRGALASLGVVSVVIAETSNLPQCTFQIKIAKA